MVRRVQAVTLVMLSLHCVVMAEQCQQALREFTTCYSSALTAYQSRPRGVHTTQAEIWVLAAKDSCDMVTIFYNCMVRLSQRCPQSLQELDTRDITHGLNTLVSTNRAWDESKCAAAKALREKEWEKVGCGKREEMLAECYDRSTQHFQAAVSPQTDGRPNFMERKACDFFTEMFQTCSDNMVRTNCYTSEDMNTMVDEHLPSELERWTGFLTDWDSDRCPIVSTTYSRWNDQGFTPSRTSNTRRSMPMTSGGSCVSVSVILAFLSVTVMAGVLGGGRRVEL